VVAYIAIVSKVQESNRISTIFKGSRRREHVELILEILELSEGGERKSRLMQRIGMCTSQLNCYLELLSRSGMIIDDGRNYVTTSKGLEFIKRFQEIMLLFS
jgi:predicted transcriptional regulator